MISLMVLIEDNKVLSGYRKDIEVQIDSLLFYGFPKDKIKVVTNFDGEYRGVKFIKCGVHFKPRRFWLHKIESIQYYLKQAPKNNEVIWYHDLDAWTNCKYEDFDGVEDEFNELGMVIYRSARKKIKKFNCGSIFMKSNDASLKEINNFVEGFGKYDLGDDEDVAVTLHRNDLLKIDTINTKYNVGVCGFRRRKKNGIVVAHVKPNVPKYYGMFEKHIDEGLRQILNGRYN